MKKLLRKRQDSQINVLGLQKLRQCASSGNVLQQTTQVSVFTEKIMGN